MPGRRSPFEARQQQEELDPFLINLPYSSKADAHPSEARCSDCLAYAQRLRSANRRVRFYVRCIAD